MRWQSLDLLQSALSLAAAARADISVLAQAKCKAGLIAETPRWLV